MTSSAAIYANVEHDSEQLSPVCIKEEATGILEADEWFQETTTDGMLSCDMIPAPFIQTEIVEPVIKEELYDDQNLASSIKEEMVEPVIKEEGYDDNIPAPSIQKEIFKPIIKEEHYVHQNPVSSIQNEMVAIIKEQHYETSTHCEGLELTVEQENFGLIFKEELFEPLVEEKKQTKIDPSVEDHVERHETVIKQECSETNNNENCESNVFSGTVINIIDAKVCGIPGRTAVLSSGVNMTGVNGVRSVTLLPEGTEFGPYPDRSLSADRMSGRKVDWQSSMRESCGEEQHNIEAVRRGGQVYYRTVTDIQPKTELVLSARITDTDANSLKTDQHHECSHCGRVFSALSAHMLHGVRECRINKNSECGDESKRGNGTWGPGQNHIPEKPNQSVDTSVNKPEKPNQSVDTSVNKPEKPNQSVDTSVNKPEKPNQSVYTGVNKPEKPNQSVYTGVNKPEKPNQSVYTSVNIPEKPNQSVDTSVNIPEKPNQSVYTGIHVSPNTQLRRPGAMFTCETPHKCCVCGECFSKQDNLESHLLAHTDKKLHKCRQCDKCFFFKSNLNRHLAVHTGEKPYKCTVCGKGFRLRNDLTTHEHDEQMHSGEKTQQCQICGKCFLHRSSLMKHQVSHSGEKPYECNKCGKCYSDWYFLKKHQRTHCRDKPHECDVCGESFLQESSLKDHQHIHGGEKSFRCHQCGRDFYEEDNLIKHQLIHR